MTAAIGYMRAPSGRAFAIYYTAEREILERLGWVAIS